LVILETTGHKLTTTRQREGQANQTLAILAVAAEALELTLAELLDGV
jgi:hypothetical protein